ncbi:MAG: hypothetical protein A2648_02125 [Candidatus Lloydbacteria bacterium RIFCSPHIGHO2_01_FULL_41_20]|uniref:Uncharacterized protein n=1 Tax=Candidatus Lloydbacteria bacterium RIFCSPHIGHO2_01_FULL_41_20 TaxID=1798657 RepID=A0A1G2CQS2_9BACT|nr:MAG: hypothetical protein A2648_02125 [Candidatus Lloydbacteria bacterium RIFCSPHIGHO2_01_FULL_41_20]
MYIRVRVTPGAKKEKIIKKKDGEYDISVREEAFRNMANRRVCMLLALEFHVPASAVHIANGHRSGVKLIRIEKV